MRKLPIISSAVAKKLVRKYGSPLYVYREDLVAHAYRSLRDAIPYPNTTIFYASKANANKDILKLLRKEGASCEAVSIGEVHAALAGGFPPHRISYTCSNIPREELLAVMRTGVRVHLDSINQIKWWGEAKPGSRISIRVNRGFGAGHHSHVITGGVGSKFGIHFSQLAEAKKIAVHYKLTIVGLHQHIGSNILNPKAFIRAMKLLLQSAREFSDLEFLDFGGGFGIPYHPKEKPLDLRVLGKDMTSLFTDFSRSYGRKLEFSVEPGRYIVAAAGALLAEVVDIKKTPAHTFVGINSGFNHLIRTAMYDSYHHIFNLTNPRGKVQPITVAGYICESGDVFCKDRPIPAPRLGDLLLFADAGAYGYAMSSNYNLRPKPKEIVI
ncbi:MAG: diaminopimelate decarboxylase [Parcubacteria group bacterium Gr01-1014_8]|nr:MAG: diaminopimelate decarboxylase [Parcubacteria group bacterium Gr01-1014_8]